MTLVGVFVVGIVNCHESLLFNAELPAKSHDSVDFQVIRVANPAENVKVLYLELAKSQRSRNKVRRDAGAGNQTSASDRKGRLACLSGVST